MPTLASSSSTQVRYAKETVFGTVPASGTKNIRVTGESLDYGITKEASKEINATRTVSSMSTTDASATGGIQAEMSYGEYDPLIAATLQSTWTVYGTNGVQAASTTIAATATTLTASVTVPTGNDAWTGLQKGQWFRLVHPTSANDGKLFRVSTVTAPTTTVITLDANTPATVAGALAGGLVQTSRLTHGTTQSSFVLERQSTDISQFMAYRGMTPSKMSLQVQTASLTSLSFDFMGKDAIRANATQLQGAVADSLNYDIQSGVSGSTCVIWENGAPLTSTYVKSVTLDFDNSLRAQGAICALGAVSIGSGTINLTVNMSVYFADGSLFDRFKANTDTSLVFSTMDSDGNGYIFTIPVANISTWKTTAGGKDSDMMVDLTFTALRDAGNATAALQKALFIDRVGVAVLP